MSAPDLRTRVLQQQHAGLPSAPGRDHDADDSGVLRRLLTWTFAGRDAQAALVVAVLAGLIGGWIMFYSLRERFPTDFEPHLVFTVAGIQGDGYPGNFLFYVLNALVAGFSTDYWWLKLSLVIVLTAAVAGKVWVSIHFIASESRLRLGAATRLPLWGAVVGGACAFAFSWPTTTSYLGQIPPNVWHNSTTITLMPFAVGLFWTTLLFLRTGERRYVWWSVLLVGLNLAAKPSFVLCFLAVFPLAALLRFRRSSPLVSRDSPLVWAAVLLACAVALLGLQYLYIYTLDPLTSGGEVTLDLFAVWNQFSTDIPLSLLASYWFPLVAVALGGSAVWRNDGVRYAAALAFVGACEYALLAESGFRLLHGNFTWQAIVTQYVLLIAIVAALIPWLRERRWGVRGVLLGIAFLIHVGVGVRYVIHWFDTGSFI